MFAIGASLPVPSAFLLHQVLIKHFLVANFVVNLVVELQFNPV